MWATSTRSAPAGSCGLLSSSARTAAEGSSVLEHELPGIRIETTIRYVKALPDRYELTTIVENEAEDHRLRVLIRSDSGADEVRAESQFAVVHRPLVSPPSRADWVEPPVPTAHTLGAVALGSLVLLTKGLPEYEASADGLRLTLLRCVGTISRPSGLPDAPCRGRPEHPHAGRPVPRPPRARVRAPFRRRRAHGRGADPGEPGLPHRLPPRRSVRASARARRRRRLLVPQAGGRRPRPGAARLQPESRSPSRSP